MCKSAKGMVILYIVVWRGAVQYICIAGFDVSGMMHSLASARSLVVPYMVPHTYSN